MRDLPTAAGIMVSSVDGRMTHRRRAKRRFCTPLSTMAMVMAMSVLCLLLSATSAEAKSVDPFLRVSMKHRSTQQNIVSNDSDDPPNQVSIHSFRVVLEPTPEKFTSTDEDELHNILQTFLSTYVEDELGSQGMLLDFLMIADVQVVDERQRRLQDYSISSILFISTGVAYFTSAAYPTESDLAALIAQGLDNSFAGALAATDFAYVETVDYISLTFSPTSSPIAEVSDEANVNDTGRNVKIAAGATGAFFGIIIVAATLFVRHKRGPILVSHLERDYKDREKASNSSIQGGDDDSLQIGSDRRTRDVSDASTIPSLDDGKSLFFPSWIGKSLLGLVSSDIASRRGSDSKRENTTKVVRVDSDPSKLSDTMKADKFLTREVLRRYEEMTGVSLNKMIEEVVDESMTSITIDTFPTCSVEPLRKSSM